MKDISTRGIKVARGSHKSDRNAGKIRTVVGLFGRHAPVDPGWLRCSIQAGGFADKILLNPGNLRHALEGIIRFNPVHKCVPAMNIVGNELLVIEFFVNYDVENAQGKSSIGARPQLEPKVGAFG